MTEKPKRMSREMFSFSECRDFVEAKLGYKIRDTLGKFDGDGVNDIEYRNWWHFLIDHRSINNPCVITIASDLLGCGNDWQNEITKVFINEFGKDVEYWVEW